jgi:hypothetical protein
MILVAAGDSFIWGSELADSPHGGPNGYSNNTFSALLAQQTNMDYVCAAYPGNANNATSVLQELEDFGCRVIFLKNISQFQPLRRS